MKIAITLGDPSGIGAEIVLKAIAQLKFNRDIDIIIFGSADILTYYIKKTNLIMPLNIMGSLKEKILKDKINCFHIEGIAEMDITPGVLSPATGKASYNYLIAAIKAALARDIDAIVTCPISKEALNLAGYNYKGHTEILAELTNTKDYAMALISDDLRIVHVTSHIPLKEVPRFITRKNIYKYINLALDCIKSLGLKNPKIAVSGLNPHAGESTILGMEEKNEIIPAINDAVNNGINIVGPFPPDTIFYRALKGEFDIVVAMYHDQGHIPMKLVHFEDSVNYTVGLPIIRTSVDHGTAFDIAGKNIASPNSLLKAIEYAALIYRVKNEIL
ncbi:MAG: 4-hydroxythreonine-4-phosphate dehydrogenase PdxA [Deferribacterota bacterium]|nr:4-hydroxythreonine-4-phosphate dehydrogenase PdxA [Deferribacterota bacterium]